ncbi:ATP-binding protein [Clavibacter michiganensis subsp. phaseoli]|uniref:ATP-binding protein n=1 Tax=Clavibacter phaseoli TaxID=1734031 RepID=A0A8I0VIM4_9MICO|nr:ATP-binding protein [Clavibacter phaseoli]MBF4632614.1 ATP-binding protein [Clavibacter phaseoli]
MSDSAGEEKSVDETDLVQVMRLAAAGHASGSHTLLRKLARKYRSSAPSFARAIVETLRDGPVRSAGSGVSIDQPLDADSRLPLIREEDPVVIVNEPILDAGIAGALQQIIDEHSSRERLLESGLAPTRTALLVGAPGVGKTLAARWIARELGLPLLVLDLSSVMSSFLGRTGGNVRRVLDYARSVPAVLLLDELDAVAKRRDDATEIGELKRLVTVLLQEIDSWPDGALLLAATNHAELLDPAVWRRFDVVLDFPLPDEEALTQGVLSFLDDPDTDSSAAALIARLYRGETLSRLERDIFRARRLAVMNGGSPVEALLGFARERFVRMPPSERGPAAARLLTVSGLSQRAVHEITGVSRDTLRKYADQMTTGEGSGT